MDRIRAALYNLDSTFAKLCIMFLLVIKYQHGDVSEPIKKHDVLSQLDVGTSEQIVAITHIVLIAMY